MIHQEQGTKTQLAIADHGTRIEPINPKSEIRNPKSLRSQASTLRPAFTLIELLVAILIIGILASALLGVAATASESAREAKTRNIIARLHTLLMEQYDTYKSRRVKVRQTVLDAINNDPSTTPAQKGAYRQQARLFALREMMLTEMPSRWSDVLLSDVPASPNGSATDARYPIYLDPLGGASASGSVPLNYRTPLAALYLRQYDHMVASKNKLDPSRNNNQKDIVTNESAELLYMIIVNATGDGEAKSLFSESSIGDTDGDGSPEFLDGWGHPISFARWAPGFASDVQLNMNDLSNTSITTPTDANTAVAKDHDPFDLFHGELVAFRLVPLIVSPGRDESLGIRMLPGVQLPASAPSTGTWLWRGLNNPGQSFTASYNSGILYPELTPYVKVTDPADSANVFLGEDDGTKTATDNVHNHLIGTR